MAILTYPRELVNECTTNAQKFQGRAFFRAALIVDQGLQNFLFNRNRGEFANSFGIVKFSRLRRLEIPSESQPSARTSVSRISLLCVEKPQFFDA
jgi:hypothetical protein